MARHNNKINRGGDPLSRHRTGGPERAASGAVHAIPLAAGLCTALRGFRLFHVKGLMPQADGTITAPVLNSRGAPLLPDVINVFSPSPRRRHIHWRAMPPGGQKIL